MHGQAAQITDLFLWETQEEGGTEHAAIPQVHPVEVLPEVCL